MTQSSYWSKKGESTCKYILSTVYACYTYVYESLHHSNFIDSDHGRWRGAITIDRVITAQRSRVCNVIVQKSSFTFNYPSIDDTALCYEES